MFERKQSNRKGYITMAVTKKTPAKTAPKVQVASKATRPTFGDDTAGKHDRFKFYAQLRVNKAIKLFKQLGNLNNKTIYSYSDAEILTMIKVLTNSLEQVKTKLTGSAKDADTSFRFE